MHWVFSKHSYKPPNLRKEVGGMWSYRPRVNISYLQITKQKQAN